MTTDVLTPRIYVACLAAYNAGKLHGKWIDANQEADDIMTDVQEMLAASPEPDAEEWAIHDYEGFEGLSLSEYEGFERVSELAAFIEEHGELGAQVMSHYGHSLEEAQEALEDRYCGEYASLEDYAEQFAEETGYMNQVPENLRYYIDFERYGRDMELNGDIFTVELGYRQVHVFWSQ